MRGARTRRGGQRRVRRRARRRAERRAGRYAPAGGGAARPRWSAARAGAGAGAQAPGGAGAEAGAAASASARARPRQEPAGPGCSQRRRPNPPAAERRPPFSHAAAGTQRPIQPRPPKICLLQPHTSRHRETQPWGASPLLAAPAHRDPKPRAARSSC